MGTILLMIGIGILLICYVLRQVASFNPDCDHMMCDNRDEHACMNCPFNKGETK